MNISSRVLPCRYTVIVVLYFTVSIVWNDQWFVSLWSFLHKEHLVLPSPKLEWSIIALPECEKEWSSWPMTFHIFLPEESIEINLLIILSGLQVFPQSVFLILPLLFLGVASKLSDVGNHLGSGDDVDLSVGGRLGRSLLVVGGNIEAHLLLHHGHITHLVSRNLR